AVPSSEIAPIQFHAEPANCDKVCGVKVIAASGGAGVNVGVCSRTKWANGCASSPGGGFSSVRLARNSGTRISTLRKKMDRVAAVLGSAPADAVFRESS